jgi:uncharacterized protein
MKSSKVYWTDETLVDFPEGEYVKQAKIGHAVMDADVFISLTHFKLHEGTGYGGAIKNIGMGCGSRAGKMEQHNAGKSDVDRSKCVGCGRCIGACPKDATHPCGSNTNEVLCRKMAEYAAAVVKGRPQFHISLIADVSPYCDCYAVNDAPVIQDVGIFASFDAVALDQACADIVNKQPFLHGSIMDECKHTHNDWSMDVHPTTNWNAQLEQAKKAGMGTRKYELVKI